MYPTVNKNKSRRIGCKDYSPKDLFFPIITEIKIRNVCYWQADNLLFRYLATGSFWLKERITAEYFCTIRAWKPQRACSWVTSYFCNTNELGQGQMFIDCATIYQGWRTACVPKVARTVLTLARETFKFNNHYINKIYLSFCYNK